MTAMKNKCRAPDNYDQDTGPWCFNSHRTNPDKLECAVPWCIPTSEYHIFNSP